MKFRKNGKVVRLTESDLQRIVKRVLKENNENEVYHHRYRDGSNPGIEDFFKDPTDRTLQDRLKQQLNDDIYSNVNNPTNIGKGTRKLFIYFNNRKMTIEKFIDQVQRDAEDGFCHTIYDYLYNNRFIGATKIDIKTEEGPCDGDKVEDKVVGKVVDKVEDKPRTCETKEWRDNVIDLSTDSSGRMLFPPNAWDNLIPTMGDTKRNICKCFLKSGDRRLMNLCRTRTAPRY